MKFELDEKERETVRKWWDNHKCRKRYAGATGGALTYKVTHTSIGTVLKAQCGFPDCKEELDLTDYSHW